MATAGLRNSAERCCTQCACQCVSAHGVLGVGLSITTPSSISAAAHGSLSEGAGTVPMQRDAPQPHAGPTSLEIPAHIHTARAYTHTLTHEHADWHRLPQTPSICAPSFLSSAVCPRSPLLSSLTVSLIAAPSAAALTHSDRLFPIWASETREHVLQPDLRELSRGHRGQKQALVSLQEEGKPAVHSQHRWVVADWNCRGRTVWASWSCNRRRSNMIWSQGGLALYYAYLGEIRLFYFRKQEKTHERRIFGNYFFFVSSWEMQTCWLEQCGRGCFEYSAGDFAFITSSLMSAFWLLVLPFNSYFPASF